MTNRQISSGRHVNWFVRIEETLAQAVELILLDPRRARVRYGARQDLINMLLREWVADIQSGRRAVPTFVDSEEGRKDG
jgi:hypothetical protein